MMRRFLVQKAYRAAYLAIMGWRGLTGAKGRGAMVAVWHGPHLLLVKPSYVNYFTFPGGRANRGEKLLDTALRELHEETGIALTADQVTAVDAYGFRMLRTANILGLYEAFLPERPEVVIDGMEIDDFLFVTLDQAKNIPLYSRARNYVLGKAETEN